MIALEEQRRIHGVLGKLGPAIHGILKEELGFPVHFVLLVSTDKDRDRSDPADSGFSAYIASNKDREANAQLLRELAARMYAAPFERAYLRSAGAPVRFFAQRVDASERFAPLQEAPGGHFVAVNADGRVAGFLMLTEAQERALLDVIHIERKP